MLLRDFNRAGEAVERDNKLVKNITSDNYLIALYSPNHQPLSKLKGANVH